MNIVVLAGGTSTERDISIMTSVKVCESLRRNGHNANIIDVFFGIEDKAAETFFNDNGNDLEKIAADMKKKDILVDDELADRKKSGKGFFGDNVLALCLKADIVFMGLHGSNGEDGKIQAVFELMGIKYTGTDYISSAISMSKELAKKVLVPEGIPMPKGVTLHKGHKIEYVPFEDTQVPIPSEYDKILQMEYGDWRTPVKQKTLHSGMIIDPDISYIEWFKRNRS